MRVHSLLMLGLTQCFILRFLSKTIVVSVPGNIKVAMGVVNEIHYGNVSATFMNSKIEFTSVIEGCHQSIESLSSSTGTDVPRCVTSEHIIVYNIHPIPTVEANKLKRLFVDVVVKNIEERRYRRVIRRYLDSNMKFKSRGGENSGIVIVITENKGVFVVIIYDGSEKPLRTSRGTVEYLVYGNVEVDPAVKIYEKECFGCAEIFIRSLRRYINQAV